MSVAPLEDEALPRRAWMKWAGLALGAALLVGAIVKLSGGGELREAARAVRGASPGALTLALLLPLVNLALTAGTFWVLTPAGVNGRARVRLGEMTALIAAAGVMNYLPIRAGMIGRIAYHKAINKIPVRESVGIIVVELIVSLVACAGLLAAAWWAARGSGAAALAIVGAPAVMGAIAAGAMVGRGGGRWRVPAAFALQYLDMLAWAGRYGVCFGVLGVSLRIAEAAALTAVSQIASLVPIGGSSLGLREWAIGLGASALPSWYINGSPPVTGLQQGLSADVMNRAFEVVVLVPIGILAAAWIGRRMGKRLTGGVTSPAA